MTPARGRLAVSVLIGLVRVAASLLFVLACKNLIDCVTGTDSGSLGENITFFVVILVVQIVTGVFASWWEGRNILLTRNQLTYSLFTYAMGSEWNGREEFHSGDIVNRLHEDIRIVTDIICTKIPNIVVTVCQLIAASLFLLTMSKGLLWLLVSLMAVGVVGAKMFYRKQRKLTMAIRSAESRAQQHMQENLLNRVLAITLIGVDKVLVKLGLIQKDIEKSTVQRLNYTAVSRAFMNTGFLAGYAAAFLWGVFGIKNGAVTFGMMTAFLQLAGQVQRPIAQLGQYLPSLIQSLSSEERLLEITELRQKEDKGLPKADSSSDLVFDRVSFTYPGDSRQVLKDFSYTFKGGKLTAIMGPTGAGKSTLIRLAMGLLKPVEGSVGVFSMDSYMYVPQGNSLMSGTIRENLLLGKADAGEEEMAKVLHTAVADFVFDLPDGLDTRCGEIGSGLSEGQSQRIAIGRALLHDGAIIILDESTSALDSATEDQLITNLCEEYGGKKTVLFISHRERVSGSADYILNI